MAKRIAAALITAALATPAAADTTENLLPPMSDFEASAGTTVGPATGCASGAYCTSGTNGGGGTFTSTFDLPLTRDEVREGFSLTYGATINSHPSNAVLSTCTSLMQSGDCRDVFNLTVTLYDGSSVAGKFEHEVELNFSGAQHYEYTSTVAANQYGTLTGAYEFYGIDAGYARGFYGPQIADPHLAAIYTPIDLVEQQLLVIDVIDTAALMPSEIPSFTAVEVDMPQPVTIEPPAAPAAPSTPADAEMEAPPAVAEIEPAAPEVEVVAEAAAEPEAAEPEADAQQASRVKYNAAVQTQALIVMAAMASRMPPQPDLLDTPGFFTSATVPDAEIPIDYRTMYSWLGAANGTHDTMVNSQWRK